MQSDKIKIKELFGLLNRHKYAFVSVVAVALGFALTLSSVMEKRYKSQFEINVYSKYFQNPLISEIVPGVYNIPEMRYTIDSMVKEALSDDYIDQLARDFEIYSLNSPEEVVAKQRQFFRERFKYYSTGGQSYRVVIEDYEPYRAKKIAEKTLDRVRGHFIKKRLETIETVKAIMLERLQSLLASQKLGAKGTSKALASRSPEALRAELSKINNNISALSKQYNVNHPKILELHARKRTVEAWLEEFKGELGAGQATGDALAMPMDKEINEALAGKFFTKFHDFNMALDIEKRSLESYFGVIERPQLPTSAVWPKKRLFAAVGLLLGIVFASLYIFFKEILAPGKKELAIREAKELGCDFLGEFHCAKGMTTSETPVPSAGHVPEGAASLKKRSITADGNA